MQQALLGEVPQVAADGVLGHAKAGRQLRGADPAVALDPLEDRLSAFSRQHLRVIARTCRFLRHNQDPRDQAKSVAVGCDWLPRASNGKEGSTVRVRQRASTKCL